MDNQLIKKRAEQLFIKYNGTTDHLKVIELLLLNKSIESIISITGKSRRTIYNIKKQYHII